jgi:hypothetical protein
MGWETEENNVVLSTEVDNRVRDMGSVAIKNEKSMMGMMMSGLRVKDLLEPLEADVIVCPAPLGCSDKSAKRIILLPGFHDIFARHDVKRSYGGAIGTDTFYNCYGFPRSIWRPCESAVSQQIKYPHPLLQNLVSQPE